MFGKLRKIIIIAALVIGIMELSAWAKMRWTYDFDMTGHDINNVGNMGIAPGGSLTIDTMALSSGSITDTTGAIGFGDEDLTTTGTITGTNIDATTSYIFSDDTTTNTAPVRTATLVVVANDSSAKSKAQADYICDGIADEVQIQAANDALPATGGEVYLTDGTFVTAAAINLDSYTNLVGAGRQATKIKCTNFADFAIKITGTAGTRKIRGSIRDLIIWGDDQANPLGGIRAEYCYIWTFERVMVLGFANASAVGIHTIDSFHMMHLSCQANLGTTGTPQGEAGFKVTNPGLVNITQISYIDSLAQYNGIGFSIDLAGVAGGFLYLQCAAGVNDTKGFSISKHALNVTIESCHIEHQSDVGDYGIYINSSTADGVRQIRILNNFFYDDKTAIYSNNATHLRIEDNFFTGSGAGLTVLDLNNTTTIKYRNNIQIGAYYDTFCAGGSITPVTISNNQWGYLGASTAAGGALLDAADADAQLTALGLSQNLGDLTDAEAEQLEAIGAATISAGQWGYLGAMDQGVATSNDVSFHNVSIGEYNLVGKSIDTIADDGVYSFTPGHSMGVMILYERIAAASAWYVMLSYRTSGFTEKFFGKAEIDVTTGALTGTTGVDGHVTISTHTDGKIYIENRSAAPRYFCFVLLG